MTTSLADVVEYRLKSESEEIFLNDWVGSKVKIKFSGKIECLHCSKPISKTYSGGYCFACMQSLPQCDMCMVKPELCHYDRGTCRDPKWGEEYCFMPHKVYLARSSGVKVGITRENPTETRWMDQGAIEGMVIAEVPDRKTSGMIETALAEHIKDKTDFRKMLRGEVSDECLEEVFEEIVDYVPMQYQGHLIEDLKPVTIKYPLPVHPQKIKTISLDKENELEAELQGIKGQYLIFTDFVFNVRAHSGYEVELEGEVNPNANKKPVEKVQSEPASLFDLM